MTLSDKIKREAILGNEAETSYPLNAVRRIRRARELRLID